MDNTMKKLESIAEHMTATQQELVEAMAARHGDNGSEYVKVVCEAAQTLAVLRVASRKLQGFDDEFTHACVGVVLVSMSKLADLLKFDLAEACKQRDKSRELVEFESDVRMLAKSMVRFVSKKELQ